MQIRKIVYLQMHTGVHTYFAALQFAVYDHVYQGGDRVKLVCLGPCRIYGKFHFKTLVSDTMCKYVG